MAGVYSNRIPPFNAMYSWPASVNCTTRTEPAGPERPSTVVRWILSILESGKRETEKFSASSAAPTDQRRSAILDIGKPPVARSGGGHGRCLGRSRHIHPHHFPYVAIGILEAAAIHKAIILLRAGIDTAAGGLRAANDIVDGLAAVGRKADQHLARRFGIRDLFRRELAKLVMGQEHGVDSFGKHHAGRGFITELVVLGRADRLIESGSAGEIGARQGGEDHFGPP